MEPPHLDPHCCKSGSRLISFCSLNFQYDIACINIFSLAVFEENVEVYCHSPVVGSGVMQKL